MKNTLLFGLGMLVLLRHSDRVKIGCQSILVNGGGGMVMCQKDGSAWVNGSYHIFRHCSLYGRGKVLLQQNEYGEHEAGNVKQASDLDSVCVFHEENGELDVFVVNKTGEEIEFSLEPVRFSEFKPIEHLEVTAELDARNSRENPDAIAEKSLQDLTCSEENTVQCRLKPYSWNVLRLCEK